VELLLDHGANVDASCSSGSTPLYIASQKGYLDVRFLFFNHNNRNQNHNKVNFSLLFVSRIESHILMKVWFVLFCEGGSSITTTRCEYWSFVQKQLDSSINRFFEWTSQNCQVVVAVRGSDWSVWLFTTL
jgi:hypothetical protein